MVNHGTFLYSFLYSLEQELQAWRSQLEMLEKKIKTTSSEERQSLQDEVENLKSKFNSLQEKVEGVKRTKKAPLPDLESDIKQSWNDLQKGLADTFERLG